MPIAKGENAMSKITNIEELKEISKNIIINIVEQIYSAQSGHPGGSLSIADVLTILYFNQMEINPENPKDEGRDRFILSKGHASAALYAVLAEKGYFPREDLKTFIKLDSYLQGHPDMKKIPGVDMTTGSLGQGLSAANGMALMSKLDKKNTRVYCLVGDGEIEEGQIWEAAMTSSHYNLDNLCLIVDNNNLQIDGTIDKVMNSYPIDEKFKSFGFNVINIDGHDYKQIINAFEQAKQCKEKPTAIIAKTIKAKVISFMESQVGWHGKAQNEEEYINAISQLK